MDGPVLKIQNDRLIGGTMTASLGLGRYREAPMTQQLFMNRAANKDTPLQMPRPEAVIVVGLGQEGKLRASDVAHTVRHGVIAWSPHVAESVDGAPTAFELAATLIGSGGTGISPGQSARLIAQGVREANLRLTASGCATVAHLHLIELYRDRATDAWPSLDVQAIATPDRSDITDTIRCGEVAIWARATARSCCAIRTLDAMFAASVAEALIKVGVRCVIAAGWAVEDDAALAFATRFYDALLGGRRFIDAVAEAREAAWHGGGNTWAAYQCYGDPDTTIVAMTAGIPPNSRRRSRIWSRASVRPGVTPAKWQTPLVRRGAKRAIARLPLRGMNAQ